MNEADRSRSPIERDDLLRLGRIAREDREDFFARLPRYRALAEHVIAVALCQGAALHYLDGRNGVEDLAVWTFYAAHPDATFPQRRRVMCDLGYPKFGRLVAVPPGLLGRHVDLLGRSLGVAVDANPVAALRAYLIERKTPRLNTWPRRPSC